MVKFDFPGRPLLRRGTRVAVRRRRRSGVASRALMSGYARLATSGAPKFRRGLAAATMLTNRRKRNTIVKPQVVKSTPGLTSHSQFTASSKPSPQVKAMKRVGAPNAYESNSGAQYLALEGFQGAMVAPWLSHKDLDQVWTHVPNNATPLPGAYKTNRIVLESGQFELLMTNSSLASCYVEIYDIARRRDANQTEFDFTGDPFRAWIQGQYNATNVDISDWTMLKATPYDSQVFKDWFKVVKRTKIELSQGATHRHHVSLRPNKLLNYATQNFVDGDYAGLTMYTLVVFYGQPASIVGEQNTAVSTAKIALDVVSTTRIKYSYVQDTTSNVFQLDNLVSLAGEQVVSCGAGAIVPNAIV